MSRSVLLACLAASLFAAAVAVSLPVLRASGDVGVYENIASQAALMARGEKALLESEYPPAASALFALAATAGLPFADAWGLLLVLAVAAAALYAGLRFGGAYAAEFPAAALLLVGLLHPETALARFDLLVGAAVYLAWRAATRGKWTDAGAAVAVAASLKLVPIVAFPVLFLLAPRGERLRLTAGFLGGAIACLLLALAVLGPSGVRSNARYMEFHHAHRGVHVETLWSSAAMAGRQAQGGESPLELRAGAYENRDLGDATMLASAALGAAGMLLLLGAAWKKKDALVQPLLLSLLWPIAIGTVFSPQYLAWVFPLLAVWLLGRLRDRGPADRFALLLGAVALASALLTQLLYPIAYDRLLAQDGPWPALLLVRNLLALGLVGLLAADWRGSLSSAGTTR